MVSARPWPGWRRLRFLALTADHRVLRRGAPIGLNEVKLGVPLPWSVTLLLRASVPPPALGRIALLGRNFSDEEAVARGTGPLVRAFEWLDKAVEERGENVVWLRTDPLHDPLRPDPRFRDVLRRLNLPLPPGVAERR